LFVRPHGRNQLPLAEVWWNLITEYFSKIMSRKFKSS
jgi:hypothetical protein